MSAKKTDWSVEKLKEWAEPALDYPELIDIARTATGNTEAKNKALEFTKERGLEEKVAMACRWLRILRAKHPERFEKLIKEGKEMGEKKMIEEVAFPIPAGTTIITEELIEGEKPQRKLRFRSHAARGLCCDLLDGLKEYAWNPVDREKLRDKMMQILEDSPVELVKVLEKKGVYLRICKNCEFFMPKCFGELALIGGIIDVLGDCVRPTPHIEYYRLRGSLQSCEHWAPKEVSGK